MGKPNILIYRRSHQGDPNPEGVFGCNDCMGPVRDWHYDSAVGVGGLKPDRDNEGIAFKINWIGIGAKKIDPYSYDPKKLNPDLYAVEKFDPALGKKFRGPWVTFKHFLLLEVQGPDIEEIAKDLYEYMFVKGRIPRAGYCPAEFYDVVSTKILSLAKNAPSSKGPTQITQGHFTHQRRSDSVEVANCGCRK